MRLSGNGDENSTAQPTTAAAPAAVGSENATAGCGPVCKCGTASSGRPIKTVLHLIVILVVVVMFSYRAPKKAWNFDGWTDATGFASAPAAFPAGSDTGSRSALETEENGAAQTVAPAKHPTKIRGSDSTTTGQKIGEDLESLDALNEIALNQDAVLILIPSGAGETADKPTRAAMRAAQETLNRRKLAVGTYTLRANSPNYAGISARLPVPAVLVGSRGRGVAAVSGEITETRLLQALAACSSGGCCGASGCN